MNKNYFRYAVLAAGLLALIPTRLGTPGGFDLAGFAALPVLHEGRIKPLDTVARTSLLMIQGKQDLTDQGRATSASQWLLDLVAHPEVSDVQRIFRIDDPDVLGLLGKPGQERRYYSFMELEPSLKEIAAQGERAGKTPQNQRGRFEGAVLNLQDRLNLYQGLKNTLRLDGSRDWAAELDGYRSFLPVAQAAILAHTKSKGVGGKTMEQLNQFFQAYSFLSEASAFRALPPLEPGSKAGWNDIGASLLDELKGSPAHPLITPYAAMVTSYRQGDAAGFNHAVADAASWIGGRQSAAVSAAAREVWFNRAEPFYRGMILYLMVFMLVAVSWAWRPELMRRCALDLLWLALIVHTAGLVFRIIIQGRPPVTNLYSSAVFVGWVAAVLGLVLERMHRNGYGALVASVTGFSTLIIAHHLTNTGDTMEMMRAVLDSNFWLGTHVVTITIGYGSMFLASALAHVYILRRWLKGEGDPAVEKSLVSMTYGVICFALFFSFVGTILGGIWADQSWGRFWGWDPKENGALLIVLWNAVVLHARWGGYVRERGLMVMAVFGGIVTSLSWFGVNMLGVGLHSYGFMEGAFEWLFGFIAVELGVMGLGLLAVPMRQTAR